MTSRYMPVVDWAQIEASAPGRFVLAGEYADLHDKNAIAVTFDKRTKVVIRPHKEGRLRLNLKNYSNVREWPITSFTMTRLVAKYADVLVYNESTSTKLNHLLHKRYYQTDPSDANSSVHYGPEEAIEIIRQADNGVMAFLILYVALGDSYAWSARPPLDIEIDSEVPIGRGLGSSSALAVAICAALMKLFRVSAEPYIISSWATNIDKFFHGVSSGLHTCGIVHGGFTLFQHSKIKTHSNMHSSTIKVMFIDTGVRRDPRIINKMVEEQESNQNHIYSAIGDIASQIWLKITDSEFLPITLALLLRSNHEHLLALGLCHDRLIDICNRARSQNLTVKQTQGGETAFMLYGEIYKNSSSAFRRELTELGYKIEDHSICFRGLEVSVVPDSAKPDV